MDQSGKSDRKNSLIERNRNPHLVFNKEKKFLLALVGITVYEKGHGRMLFASLHTRPFLG
jgi:hypothetical protein